MNRISPSLRSTKFGVTVIAYLFIILLSSCSLKYSESVSAEDKVPEFVFENTEITRYEDGRKTLNVSAEALEQYKGTNESYAKGVAFTAYDDNGEVSTEGECGILFADNDKKIYELYDNISLYNTDEKMRFSANMLRWNGNTEQLTGGRGDMVKIEKDDTIIRGSGFSASGISKTFSFKGNVTGDITTKEAENGDSNTVETE